MHYEHSARQPSHIMQTPTLFLCPRYHLSQFQLPSQRLVVHLPFISFLVYKRRHFHLKINPIEQLQFPPAFSPVPTSTLNIPKITQSCTDKPLAPSLPASTEPLPPIPRVPRSTRVLKSNSDGSPAERKIADFWPASEVIRLVSYRDDSKSDDDDEFCKRVYKKTSHKAIKVTKTIKKKSSVIIVMKRAVKPHNQAHDTRPRDAQVD